MRFQSIMSIIVLLCFTAVAATTINAQSTPFEFVLADRTLPSGKYSVERIDAAKPNLLLLKNSGNVKIRLIIAQRTEKEETSTSSSLIFRRQGEKLYLFQVWMIGDRNGNQLPLAYDGGARG